MYNLTNDTELEHTYMFKWLHRRKDNHSKHLSEFKERLVMQELAICFKRLGAWGNSWFTTLAKSGT